MVTANRRVHDIIQAENTSNLGDRVLIVALSQNHHVILGKSFNLSFNFLTGATWCIQSHLAWKLKSCMAKGSIVVYKGKQIPYKRNPFSMLLSFRTCVSCQADSLASGREFCLQGSFSHPYFPIWMLKKKKKKNYSLNKAGKESFYKLLLKARISNT